VKILHINAGNLSSGAGIGALSIHLALLEMNVESKFLFQMPPKKNIPEGYHYSINLWKKIIRFFYTHFERLHLFYFKRKSKNLFSTSIVGLDLSNHPLIEWADIIHLHWINQGFVSLSFFEKVNKPIIWTLRDMWPFTGGCHQSFDCTQFTEGCGKCPMLDSSCKFDLSRIVYNKKLKKIRNFQAIGISDWVTELALQSKLFKENKIDCYTINNIVQVELFNDIAISDNSFNSKIYADKFLILVGALDVSSDYKGYRFIRELFTRVNPERFHWLAFGDYDISNDFPADQCNYTHFGYVKDAESLSKLYSLADVFLSASVAESFGKTIIEAQSCGTPVVCFDMCGPKYLVTHKITGYKAIPLDIEDLINGINWVIDNDIKRKNKEEIKLFSKRFSKEENISSYINLYKKLLNATNSI
jgi:glycosyltransferase involved in cell wall biosynthesis